ncbi:POC1 centriolar protein A, partial [Tulasnella sp. 331]
MLEGICRPGEIIRRREHCQQERASQHLGGEFYFTVSQPELNDGVIAVLTRQPALWRQGKLRFEIANAISEDGEIGPRKEEAFEKLIQEPLETLVNESKCPPLFFLLDGLDEYENELASNLLQGIGKGLAKLPKAVRLIITSRPEPHLIQLYHGEPLKSRLEICSLDLEDQEEVEGDIGEFLRQKLPEMVWGWVTNPSDWPGEERRKALGYNTDLYSIYSKIIDRAFPPGCDSDLLALLRDVLGTLPVVQVPVNIHTLTSTLCHRESELRDYTHRICITILAYLQAVLVVPGVEEADASRNASPICFVHKSFGDYLTDQSRSDPRFIIDTAHFSHVVAVRCLTSTGLKRNICDLGPPRLNSEIGRMLGSDTDVGIAAAEQDKEDKEDGRLVNDFKRGVEGHVSAGPQYA